MWNHPDFLPTAEDVDKPAEFIDSLLGESDGADFDPIAEITALEKLLAEESEKKQKDKDSEDPEDENPEDKDS